MVIIIVNVVVGLLGFIVYLIDSHGKTLIDTFKMGRFPLLFYYLVGLTLSLSLIGMVFSCIPRPEMGNQNDVVCCSGCDGMYFYPYPYTATSESQVCCCNCCPGECGGCHPVACCECGDCAGAAVGEEAFICVMVVLVVFAVLGVFYCLGMGAYYVQHVTQRHIHVLQKRGLVEEYVVADLAEGAMSLDYRPPLGDDMEQGTMREADVENALHSRRTAPGDSEGIEMSSAVGLHSHLWDGAIGSGHQYARVTTSDSGGMDDSLRGTELSSSIVQPSAPPTDHAPSAPPAAGTAPAVREYGEYAYLSTLPRPQREELNRLGLL